MASLAGRAFDNAARNYDREYQRKVEEAKAARAKALDGGSSTDSDIRRIRDPKQRDKAKKLY